MEIIAIDIIEWRKRIIKSAKAIASLRGNVSDSTINTLSACIKDMGFLVSFAESKLTADCPEFVRHHSMAITDSINSILSAEDERVRQIREAEETHKMCEFLDSLDGESDV